MYTASSWFILISPYIIVHFGLNYENEVQFDIGWYFISLPHGVQLVSFKYKAYNKNEGTLWTIYGFESKTKIGSVLSAGKLLLHRELYSWRNKKMVTIWLRPKNAEI